MDFKKLSLGLGLFSLGLGAAELLASRRIAKALEAEGSEGLIKTFGAREVASGAAILQSPAHGARIWNRVAGDVMDLAALGALAHRASRNKALWASFGLVVVATAADVITALGLDRTTGKTLPQQS